MSNKSKDVSEKAYQESFVKELQKYKWNAPDCLNGNIRKVTVRDLIENWRGELNRINADQLEGVELTDEEFRQVMSRVNQISDSYEAAKLLAMEESTGKIDSIYRDDNPKITRKVITLTIFKKAEVRGGDSSYTIAREVETEAGNRFDIVLLINGLPLINIEQKRTDKSLEEAYGQLKRYYRDGEYSYNFMAFSQMMVINSEIETRYFATPKSLSDFNLSFVFRWSDKNNNRINKWRDVIKEFLMIPMAHQIVGDYLIIDESKNEEKRKHMVMRPYQVYALQAIEGAALGWDNKDGKPHGGFIWHTTGSGKTITSFKSALFLSTRANFDKVIFMLDRTELDRKTVTDFEAYAAYESISVDNTPHTYKLKQTLKSAETGIVVTTTFKLNSLIKDLEESEDYSLNDKKFVFIVDEAHRTTMGEMLETITGYFKKNGLFYGFTGTPLFDQNKAKGMINEKSELINTTEKLFGPCLHEYTIDEAIADGNVLGFYVDYINTGEFKDYDDLREKLNKKIQEEKPDLTKREIERLTQRWSDLEVEKQAKKNKLLLYQDKNHIPRVVEEILNNWDLQSQECKFNAILTVAYKERVIAYYKELKKQMEERNQHYNIAMTFSFGNENDPENVSAEVMNTMFTDYEKYTGIKFTTGDKRAGEKAYFDDLTERATNGGSGRNEKNVDLIIVADQLLTGYDSKYLNTLYVDRSLELQGLIQAYSRTNRVFGPSKEFGTIINFQYPKITEENVNEALKLYGSGGTSSKVIVDTYNNAVAKLSIKVKELKEVLSNPTNWTSIEHDKELIEEYRTAFRATNEQLNTVEQYYEFRWDNETFGIDEHTWLKYIGAYKNLPDGSEDNPPEELPTIPLVGKTKLVGTQVIDAAHILSLIGSKVQLVDGIQTVDKETLRIIHEQIQELSNIGEAEQAKLLKKFVDTELVAGHITSDMNFDVAYEKWKKELNFNMIKEFSNEWGLQPNLLKESVQAYNPTQPGIVPFLDELLDSSDYSKATVEDISNELEYKMEISEFLITWIKEMTKKF